MEKSITRSFCPLVVIGGSAGSLGVILKILPNLDKDLKVALIIVLHQQSSNRTSLTDLLSHKTQLTVKEAEGKEAILPGIIYIAPPDYHLLIEKDGSLSLDYSEKINYSRPSIDVSFQTAAEAYGTLLTCLLLSGANIDGTAGMAIVKSCGGITAVQNPATAEIPFMPLQALNNTQIDYILDDNKMAEFINSLATKTNYI